MGVHIEHHLWGRAEFEAHINRITVDFRSSSKLHLALNDAKQYGHEPLHSIEGCALNYKNLALEKHGRNLTRPSPFSRGMWVGYSRSTKEIGSGLHQKTVKCVTKTWSWVISTY